MRLRKNLWAVKLACLWPLPASAHVSEQGFVLLLPTGAYTAAGVAAVALTVLALFAVPAKAVRTLFAHRALSTPALPRLAMFTSLLSFAAMLFVLWIGLNGPRDPLANLMPLSFWTLGWMLAVSLAAVFGNLWHWFNPWTGLYQLMGTPRPLLEMPERIGLWPATLMLIGFAGFLLADIAPDDPGRLARTVGLYWLVIFAGLLVFGPRWLHQAELGHAIFAAYASLAPVRLGSDGGIGGPGWQVLEHRQSAGAGLFALVLLGVGSFDGLNETFWWLAQIGVNPLEFPGRSAVILPTLTGLLLSVLALCAVFAVTIWIGLALTDSNVCFARAFGWLALSLLPIALVYHIAHYFTSFLVLIQYSIAAISDPFAQGTDWLVRQPFRVTTGFFNSMDSVRLIWMVQAGLVVLGHVWSVLLSHRMALSLFESGRQAAWATLPLSLFMIGYTFLGLWLLAAPKGA